jgi:hypothetical protein
MKVGMIITMIGLGIVLLAQVGGLILSIMGAQ